MKEAKHVPSPNVSILTPYTKTIAYDHLHPHSWERAFTSVTHLVTKMIPWEKQRLLCKFRALALKGSGASFSHITLQHRPLDMSAVYTRETLQKTKELGHSQDSGSC